GTGREPVDFVQPGVHRRSPGGLEPRDALRDPLDRPPTERDLLPRRDVGDGAARCAARLERDLAEQARLRRRHDAVRHPNAHHEVARCALTVEDTDPLQALDVVVAESLPAFPREAHEILGDVETVLLALERLDLVHTRASPASPGAVATLATRTAGLPWV